MDGRLVSQLRKLLMNRWNRTVHQYKPDTDNIEEDPNPSGEIGDIAQALEQIDRDVPLKEAERRDLIAIEKALGKMTIGTFGICEDCEEEIPYKRLLVLPEARLCAHCQAFEEKQSLRTHPGRALAS